jgi:hypothetical protein
MSLTDDQRDAALKALRNAEEALEYVVSGVKRGEEAATLRTRIEEVEAYLNKAKSELKFM